MTKAKRLSRLSQEEREAREKQICELYQQGYSMRQVGKLVGVSHQTVNTITKKYGIQFSPQERRKLRLGARDEKLIEELLSSGKTVAEVAPKHGMSQRHAYVVLREAGVYKNRSASAATAAEGSVQYGSVVHKNQEKIRTMYAAGYSGKNIAEEMGTTQREIQGIISGCRENEELREQHRKNQEQFVLEDFDAGIPVEEISRKRGIPYPRICVIAKKHKRHYITAHDDRDYAVLKAYDAGLSVKDIADSVRIPSDSLRGRTQREPQTETGRAKQLPVQRQRMAVVPRQLYRLQWRRYRGEDPALSGGLHPGAAPGRRFQ